MYILGNIEARLCNHCCSGKAMSTTYSECVFVGLGIQHAIPMRRTIPHIVISVLSDSYPSFPHYFINCTIFGIKVLNTKCVF
jgi:hypothetical protein